MHSSLFKTAIIPALIKTAFACPEHENHGRSLNKRATGTQDWTYEASYNWGMINTGTTQSPIQLRLDQGLAQGHQIAFDTAAYSSVAGTLSNWGYGPAFTVNASTTSAPSFTYLNNEGVNETLYLKGWHIHSPADHSFQGDKAKSELHLVHTDSSGIEAGVLALRIDPGNANSTFFNSILSAATLPGFSSTETIPITLDLHEALQEVNLFSDYWTYMGSLTSPPCTEGIRWWVARNTLWVGNEQMGAILGVSTFSARAEQEVWLHAINA